MAEEFQLYHVPKQFFDFNYTLPFKSLDIGAYSNIFAYECSLIAGLITGLYLNIKFIRACRYHLMFCWELIACALGISGFTAFDDAGKTPTKIAYSALVLIIVNLAFSALDMILCFKNRALHTLHLLVANGALWVGSIATTAWYRDNLREHGYTDLWVFSFICMWGGAMIALPAPGTLNYVLLRQGPYEPTWSNIDPAEIARNTEKAKKKAEKDAEKKEREAQKEKEKAEKDKKKKKDKTQEEETEMVAPSDFVNIKVKGDDDDESSDEEERRKKKKKRKKERREREKSEDADGEEKEKPKKDKDKGGKKKDKDKDKDKDKEKEKAKKKKKSKKTSDSDSD